MLRRSVIRDGNGAKGAGKTEERERMCRCSAAVDADVRRLLAGERRYRVGDVTLQRVVRRQITVVVVPPGRNTGGQHSRMLAGTVHLQCGATPTLANRRFMLGFVERVVGGVSQCRLVETHRRQDLAGS